jgi:putative membrane protein insertion efficiency factor
MRISKSFCIACVKAYRYTLAPLFLSLGVQCRFTPSCSEYAVQSFEAHGALRGLLLTLGRLLRCQPFCAGGHDPVPSHLELGCARCAPAGEISHG